MLFIRLKFIFSYLIPRLLLLFFSFLDFINSRNWIYLFEALILFILYFIQIVAFLFMCKYISYAENFVIYNINQFNC